ncbi:MAG TPA: aromatic ring-hydroxylating dioxygenase subunit alpha [Blastocatellia bacterium]|nr:aromatic ring-hydroxylating dioxygenase subunit alpha [Blastocatellia bacterium]
MNRTTDTRVFNNAQRVVEGWYWAMRSAALKRGRAKALSFMGREMALYRGEDGRVCALDAYCPHMGAHLAEGKVEGGDIRCLFHYWKYDAEGRCVEIPCQRDSSFVPQIRSWPVEEKYGLIWIWAGREPRARVPAVPELADGEVEFRLAKRFTKRCHPNVMMINAIDAQHFNSVHKLPVDLRLEPEVVSDSCILFRNTTKVRPASLFTSVVSRFYKDALTYVLCYWFGSTGAVTIGPDFLHFHIIFALRPTVDGRSEGQTILVTRKRKGVLGKAFSRALLLLTRIVGAYFAKGDTLIFETIRFNFRTPIKADSSIIRFIEHVERQRTVAWGLESEGGDEREAKIPRTFSLKSSASG